MNKALFFGLFLFIGINCFSQQLVIASIERNGSVMLFDRDGNWPTSSNVSDKWNSLFTRYNLVKLESDPFNPNQLIDRIIDMADNSTVSPDGFTLDRRGNAYTAYLTMGNRRFICLFYYEQRGAGWYWVFEIDVIGER
jgi:hypothetical protein